MIFNFFDLVGKIFNVAWPKHVLACVSGLILANDIEGTVKQLHFHGSGWLLSITCLLELLEIK